MLPTASGSNEDISIEERFVVVPRYRPSHVSIVDRRNERAAVPLKHSPPPLETVHTRFSVSAIRHRPPARHPATARAAQEAHEGTARTGGRVKLLHHPLLGHRNLLHSVARRRREMTHKVTHVTKTNEHANIHARKTKRNVNFSSATPATS